MRRLALLVVLIACKAKKEPLPVSTSIPPAESSTSRRTSSCGDEIIGDEGIGQLRIGTTVHSIRQKCNVVRDTTVIVGEGMPARKLAVAFSQDTVDAEVVDDRVWRIAVLSPRLKTADSLGVGTTIARLVQLNEPRGMTGEGEFSSRHRNIVE